MNLALIQNASQTQKKQKIIVPTAGEWKYLPCGGTKGPNAKCSTCTIGIPRDQARVAHHFNYQAGSKKLLTAAYFCPNKHCITHNKWHPWRRNNCLNIQVTLSEKQYYYYFSVVNQLT